MEKKKQIIAIFFAVMVLFVMLFSALLNTVDTEHDCLGEDCPICCQVNICQDSLKNLILAVCTVVIAFVLRYNLPRRILVCADSISTITLVSLKMELLN